jgi:hypothetical protein
MSEERLYISDVAKALNRRPNTVRGWHRDGVLPTELQPNLDERAWRYWTPKQVEGIREWLVASDRRPGKALPNYNPSHEEALRHIEKARDSRAA